MEEIVCGSVICIDKQGILAKQKSESVFISFEECAQNFALENGFEKSRCVAVRCVEERSFTFYTSPKVKIIFKRNFLKDLLPNKSALHQFHNLQRAIQQMGFSTYDLS